MASKIEGLPTELLEPILRDLTINDISKLRRCNKFFYECLEAFICRLPFANHKLMRWGCVEGEKWAIQKALKYGADISFLEIRSPALVGPDGPVVFKVSTLFLALRRFKNEIFHFLIDSGARLDAMNTDYSLDEKFRQRFFHPNNHACVQQCIDRGFHENIMRFEDGINQALMTAVKQDFGLEICQKWLDLGADSTALISRSGRFYLPESVLALAILAGSVPLTRLLLAKKPNLLFQATLSFERNPPWETMPMLAAARRMATHGETEFMDMLLEAGGDINAETWAEFSWFNALRKWQGQGRIDPMMVYLFSARFNSQDEGIYLPMSHGLLYLLDRGAVMKNNGRGLYWFQARWEAWACELELALLHDGAYSMLQILIQNGAARGCVSALLRSTAIFEQCDGFFELSLAESRILKARWQTILGLLLRDENFETTLSQEIHGLLHEFLDQMFINFSSIKGLRDPCPLEALDRHCKECNLLTIQKLLEKGANINWISDWTGRCILGHLFHKHTSGHEDILYDSWDKLTLKRQRSFANALICLGARPSVFLPQGIDTWEKFQEIDGANYPYERKESICKEWFRVFRGEMPEEERLLWNPKGGPLMDGTWKNMCEEAESPGVFVLPEYLQRNGAR